MCDGQAGSLQWATHIEDIERAVAPIDLEDPQAFYVVAESQRLEPAGVNAGDYCLVSPNSPITPYNRIWVRRNDGSEGLRWLVNWWREGFETVHWALGDRSKSRQQIEAEQIGSGT